MSVTVRTPAGPVLYCKGAPDVLLGLCTHIAAPAGVRAMTAADRRAISAQAAEMARSALRVLAFAESTTPQKGEKGFALPALWA